MRILWWLHSFYPKIGGVEIVGAELARGLSARGYEIEVIVDQDPSLPSRGEVHGIPIYRFPFFQALESRDPDRIHAVRRGILERMDHFRPDLIHLHTTASAAFFCLMAMGQRPTPLLLSRHELLADQPAGPGTLPVRLLKEAAWTACCSQAVLEETIRRFPEAAPRTSVVLNGLSPPRLAPTPPPPGPPRLLCIGRVVEQKGFDLAIEAFAGILSRMPGAQLHVVGEGPALGSLRDQAQSLGMESAIRFPGRIDPGKVPAAIAASTAVVMPSRAGEGLPLVALQAAHMARPVVATRVGGLPEIVVDGQTGILVEPDDAKGLARALIELLDDPARAAELGRAARERALTVFSGDRYLNQYALLYDRHAKESPHGPDT